MYQKHLINLTAEECQQLVQLLSAGDAPASTLKHTFVLLKSDGSEGGPSWPYAKIWEAFEVAPLTVFNVRKRYCYQDYWHNS